MTPKTTTNQRRFVRSDLAILLASVLGFGLLIWGYPRIVHGPERDASLGMEGAIQAAAGHLEILGYDAAGMQPTASYVQNSDALRHLQHLYGRSGAIRAQSDSASEIFTHHWKVAWHSESAGSSIDAIASRFELDVDNSGRLIAFQNPSRRLWARDGLSEPGNPVTEKDQDTIALLLRTYAESNHLPPADSLRHSDVNVGSQETSVPDRMSPRRDDRFVQLQVARARHYLSMTPFARRGWSLDSLSFQDESQQSIFLAADAPAAKLDFQTEISIGPRGNLLRLTANSQSPAGFVEHRRLVGTLMGSSDEGIVIIGLLFAVVMFIRLLSVSMIDGRVAIRDAIICGCLGAVGVGAIIIGTQGSLVADDRIQILIVGIAGAAFSGVGIGLLAYLASGTSISLGRQAWPSKIASSALLRRRGGLISVPVGVSILRGLLCSGVVVGATMLALYSMKDHSGLIQSGRAMWSGSEYPVLGELGLGASMGFVKLSVLLLALGSWLKRHLKKGMLVGVLVLGAMSMAGFSPMESTSWQLQLALSFASSTCLLIAFRLYDFIVPYVAFISASAVFFGADLVQGGMPMPGQLFLLAGALVTFLTVGLIGYFSKRQDVGAPEYVPDYITELSQRERLNRELEIAHQVQASFLPQKMPQVPGLDVAAICLPAQEVGGDYFDFIRIGPSKLGVVIGDVSGKGIEAAFYMTLAKGFVQSVCHSCDPPAEVLSRVNSLFCANAKAGTFISMIYGVVDLEARTFTFARAGHNPVILKRSPSQTSDVIQPAGLAIGFVDDRRFQDSIEEIEIPIRTGDLLVLYTDGFSEAMNETKELYTDERLNALVANFKSESAASILETISGSVDDFTGSAGRHDDMTMVIMKIEASDTVAGAVT